MRKFDALNHEELTLLERSLKLQVRNDKKREVSMEREIIVSSKLLEEIHEERIQRMIDPKIVQRV